MSLAEPRKFFDREHVEFFSSLLDLVNDLVWSTSLDGKRLLYLNDASGIIYGRPVEELVRHRSLWIDCVHDEDRNLLIENFQKILEAKQIDQQFRIVQPNGKVRWLQGSLRLIQDRKGKPLRIGGIAKDVTRRVTTEQELDEAKAIYQSLVESLPINVFRKDREGKIVFGNKRYCDALNQKLDELIGKTDEDLFSRELADKYVRDDKWVLQTGLPFHDIEEHPGPEGSKSFVEVLKAPVRDSQGKRIGIQGMFWDVTTRIQAENALREAKDLAEAASRSKSDFLANMSHEIRTPMNAILGMTELVLETSLTSSQREYLTMVQASGEALLSLLNDILDFSKIEAGKLEFDNDSFDLRDSLSDAMRTLATKAFRKKLELAINIHPDVAKRVITDAGRLRQVIMNLVGNAIKFTDEGEIVLSVQCLGKNEDEATLRFHVKDTGIGISPAKIDRIFAEFEQADTSTTRQFGGTGLGLAISRRIVELMGGTLQVKSELGVGSNFFFDVTLPIDHEEFQIADQVADVSDIVVLVVDDNQTNRQILDVMLNGWGMKPIVCDSAVEAFEVLRQSQLAGEPIQLVLSDVNMPDNDGFELVEWIRSKEEIANTKVIMLTSGSRPGDFEAKRGLKIDAHLMKPVKQSDLFNAIGDALNVSEHTRARRSQFEEVKQQIGPLKILLAEDNLVNQRLAIGLLEKFGHNVTVAINGAEAVEKYREGSFDVVLMDVQMPEMDGFEATAAIREIENQNQRRTPIIAMTAHAMVGDRQRCLDAGMDDYISKPIRVPALISAISGLEVSSADTDQSQDFTSNSSFLVDWSMALETVGGDRNLLKDLINIFIAESDKMLNDISKAIQSRNAKELRRAAHAVKGALRHLGAQVVSEPAVELEKMGEDERFDDAEPLVNTLRDKVEQLTTELRGFKNS
jgi:two-component system, sensor histidine kinase and response regulator